MSLLARFRLKHANRPADHAAGDADDDALSFPLSSSHARTPKPPPAQRQRERSPSSEEALEKEAQLRHKQRCACKVCQDLDLDEDALLAFSELDLPNMLITIFGKLLWLERQRMRDEVQFFIKSDDFKDVVQDQIRTVLLSANLSRYLNGINDRIWGFLKRNLAVFNIPPLAMEDARLTIYIDGLVKDVLMKQRSQIKTKIATSVLKSNHISDLAKSLAGRDFVNVTMAQWGRFTFLRQNFILFSTMVDESLVKKVNGSDAQEQQELDNDRDDDDDPAHVGRTRNWSSHQFWDFIDELLDEMRDEVHKETNVDHRKQAWECFFTDCLQSDLEQFPAENRSASLHPSDGRSIPEWQKAIQQELVWL